MFNFSEGGNEVVFGNVVKKNLVSVEIHVPSRVFYGRIFGR